MLKEDIVVIIRSVCQKLYDNIRHNESIFSDIRSKRYLNELKSINKKTNYQYIECIRDELGILHKNYLVFCKKQEYDNNSYIISEIKKYYIEINAIIMQLMMGNSQILSFKDHKKIEMYIDELKASYGGRTEHYIKKLSKTNLGQERKEIEKIYKDKSKIISQKKFRVLKILEGKINYDNNIVNKSPNVKIVYNSIKAEYYLFKKNTDGTLKKKKYKFNTKFDDIEHLQKNAIRKLRNMNFGISIYEELEADENHFKYADPFILMIFIEEGLLDYAKLYLKKINGEGNNNKDGLPFKIVYKIDDDLQTGELTPVRNEIISIIAERSSLSVANIKKISAKKAEDKKI